MSSELRSEDYLRMTQYGTAQAIETGATVAEVKSAVVEALPKPELQQDLEALDIPSFSDLQHIAIPEKKPLFADFLYPGAFLVVGRPKIGKSWLLLQLAMAVSSKTSFLGFDCSNPCDVLVFFTEDDNARIKSRLDHIGTAALPTNVRVINQEYFLSLARRFSKSISFPRFLDLWLKKNPTFGLVVIDTEVTARQLWDGERALRGHAHRIVETDYKQTREFDEISLRHRAVVLLTNHARKNNGDIGDVHELINRSNTALAGCSGSIVLADMPGADPMNPECRDRILAVRGRDLRDDILLAVTQNRDNACFEKLGPFQEVTQSQREEEILCALEELCKEREGYVTATDVARELSQKPSAVKKALQRMYAKPDRRLWRQYRLTQRSGRNGGWKLDPT